MASILSAVLVAMVVCATVSAHEWSLTEWEALKTVSHSNLDFSNSLYKVMSHHEGNLFFSPASIHTILALTSLGARGPTAQEMVDGLHLPTDQQKTKDGFRHLMSSLHDNSSVVTKIANKIFTDTRYAPTPEFVQTAVKDFHSGTELVDFLHKHEEARVNINTWVESNTEHKIKNLLPSGSLDSSTAMVLVNALYFKGAWDKVFHVEATRNEPFHVTADVTKDVPMMHMFVKGKFGYVDSEKLKADVLEIPYVGHKISMIIILPKEKNGLSAVETRLAGLRLSTITSAQITHPNVHLTLPKFKLEESLDLKATLIQMGMEKMFSSAADFTGLAPGKIAVSKVIHKAFIEVDENGTEAAAATAVEIGLSSSLNRHPPPEITFKADHPFIFMLVNTEHDADSHSQRTVLFMGRYAQLN